MSIICVEERAVMFFYTHSFTLLMTILLIYIYIYIDIILLLRHMDPGN